MRSCVARELSDNHGERHQTYSTFREVSNPLGLSSASFVPSCGHSIEADEQRTLRDRVRPTCGRVADHVRVFASVLLELN